MAPIQVRDGRGGSDGDEGGDKTGQILPSLPDFYQIGCEREKKESGMPPRF